MLTDVDSDVKGDAFEYFLKASTSTKNDLGEYFTPRHIVKTMVRLVNPQIGEKIYDPFCGTGGFLIESFRYIQRNIVPVSYTHLRFTNWKGERKQTQKRGFATKREALAWEHETMLKQGAKLDMTFASFFEVYKADKKQRVKESTWESKSHVIRTKILPYFENRKIDVYKRQI